MSSFSGTPNATNSKRASKMNSQAVNLNHLLNFTLPPRQAQPLANLPRRSRRTGTQQVWNKERFINAQYRFVMNPMGDYTVHFADPDIFFQWNDIMQVIIPRASALASAAGCDNVFQGEGHTTCPICLSPPTASRMTKCGHVYCYPCILHYLSTSDKGWARCPICFDSINDKQLKNVKWFGGPTCDSSANNAVVGSSASSTSAVDNVFEAPRAGSIMRLRLMQRPQITTLALPRSQTWPSDVILPHQAPFHFLPDVFDFSKFMLATPDYLIADLSNDLDELALERRTLAGMSDDLGISFVDSAEQKVRNQIARANAMDNPILREQIDKSRQALRDVEDRQAPHPRRQAGSVTSAPNDVPEESPSFNTSASLLTPSRPSSVTRNGPRQRRNLNPPPPSTSTYYYYQAASGLPIYLHPLDIRILLSHFASYPAFPDTIDIRVEAFSEGTVNEDLRKRCKYLAHMPEGADVVFIEADLTRVVGPEGLKNFDGPLKMRTSRRKDKIRKDDRARTKADERERERRLVNSSSWSGPTAQSSVVWQSEPDSPVQAQVSLPPAQESGAWGARSFASTLQSAGTPGAQRGATQRDEDDEWDIDAAWHELETRNGNTGGRRKKSNKLVLIGGGGGPGRRR